MSFAILFYFYKNILFTMCQFYFGFTNLFSRQSLFNDWAISFFNSAFTGYSLLFYGVFEKDIKTSFNDSLLPQTFLYFFGQRNLGFNKYNFFGAIVIAFSESAFIFLFIYFLDMQTDIFSFYRENNYEMVSTLVYATIIFQIQFKLCIYTKNYSILMILGYAVLGFGVYLAYIMTGHLVHSLSFYMTGKMIWLNPNFYLVLFLINASLFFTNFLFLQVR